MAWLCAFHRDRRCGLDGVPTWAVVVHGLVVGSVRLKRTEDPQVLEAGAWSARSVRGQGVGRASMVVVWQQAAIVGVDAVRADTTAGIAVRALIRVDPGHVRHS